MEPEGEEEAGVDPVVGVARGPVEAEERDLGDVGDIGDRIGGGVSTPSSRICRSSEPRADGRSWWKSWSSHHPRQRNCL